MQLQSHILTLEVACPYGVCYLSNYTTNHCWEFFLHRQVLGLFGRLSCSQERKLYLSAKMPDENI